MGAQGNSSPRRIFDYIPSIVDFQMSPGHQAYSGIETRLKEDQHEEDYIKQMTRNRGWWRRLPPHVRCPLADFPISMLPYPPFKLAAQNPDVHFPYIFVDGRFLALQW